MLQVFRQATERTNGLALLSTAGRSETESCEERELTVERARASLEVARQLARTGGRKRQMMESKIKSAKKLLANRVSARDVASNLGVSIPHPI